MLAGDSKGVDAPGPATLRGVLNGDSGGGGAAAAGDAKMAALGMGLILLSQVCGLFGT